ncbi:hypothetical protein CVIRNUC_002002 [Coccomyxa viridis]|uniref:Uncharacterized protein n=1 Tax=Coccomyxa viridis TaxID=1274662 RepID=A0AAV1HUQ6_9CHLO|nr:hypothetical protein CVIRNUC_002002 [Coccomyxa viridis]
MTLFAAIALCALLRCTLGYIMGPHRMLQQTASSSVDAPVDTAVLLTLRGIGTQNYTAQKSTSYLNTGARADLYSNSTLKRAIHFFDDASHPTWILLSPTGSQEGMVHGRIIARSPMPASSDDGGFGSVDALLLKAFGGEGTLASCTYIQRLNVNGGGAPKGFHTLPAWNGIASFEAAFPYQAIYTFSSGGS